MKKRSHKNTTRITAGERALKAIGPGILAYHPTLARAVQRAIQTHTRRALERARGRTR